MYGTTAVFLLQRLLMKWILCFFASLLLSRVSGQHHFRFAFISDTHIGSPSGAAEEDLRRTVADINAQPDIAFVVLTGDITELGKSSELALAKALLDSLHIKYYIIPGNHDTGWSESGGLGFSNTFGDDKFHFVQGGVHFIGCASGPYVRMSDGHVPRQHIEWLKKELAAIHAEEPIVFLNHYPLDAGLDNWYEVIDLLKQKATQLVLCGHGHANKTFFFEGLPGVMGRSNLRAKETEGGYNLVTVSADTFRFVTRRPVTKTEKEWAVVAGGLKTTTSPIVRPDFSMNDTYKQISPEWTYSSTANIAVTPALLNNKIIVANTAGVVEALHIKTGKKLWQYKTGGPVYGSPVVSGKNIIVGSADGMVYCLTDNGKIVWRLQTGGPVLGTAAVQGDTAFIAGSDGCMQGILTPTGKPVWRNCLLKGPATGRPVLADSLIIFGAWDTYLYALHKSTGKKVWQWSNGSAVANYSPAAGTPVVQNGTVYVVAPDRTLSAIAVQTGKTAWRTNEVAVRESIGASEDGSLLFVKSMQDTVAAFYANTTAPKIAWKLHVGFGYEHVPNDLIAKDSAVYFGTRNGVVYKINTTTKKVDWAYKIDNSMVNTVRLIDNKTLAVSTTNGKVVLLQEKPSGGTAAAAKALPQRSKR